MSMPLVNLEDAFENEDAQSLDIFQTKLFENLQTKRVSLITPIRGYLNSNKVDQSGDLLNRKKRQTMKTSRFA